MTDKMREALVAALSTHSSDAQAKLAAIAFFELARKEGMVLDDFLSLKAKPVCAPGSGLLATPSSPTQLAEALHHNITAMGEPRRRCVQGVPVASRPTREALLEALDAADFDWQSQAGWLDYPPGHPERDHHQAGFQKEQSRKGREGVLSADISLEELCQQYLWFGIYKGWYVVEVPSGFFHYLIKRKPPVGDKSGFQIKERTWQTFERLLDCRDQGILPDVPEGVDKYVATEWKRLADLA